MDILNIFIILLILINGAIFILCNEFELLDLSCSIKADCLQFELQPDGNVTCLNGKCICNNINGRQINCEPKQQNLHNYIGKSCPCRIDNSNCDNNKNICLCREGFVPSFDKLRCIKRFVELNESCEDNSQCKLNDVFSICNLKERKCKCQENFINHKGKCFSVVGLGESCFDDKQCINKTKNSLCSNNGKCICAQDYVANKLKNVCLPTAGFDEPCIITDQCKHKLGPGSECYSGNCTCDSRHYPISDTNSLNENKKLCERLVDLGDFCKDHNDCYHYHLHPHEQYMECYLGECVCRNGYEEDFSKRNCFKNGATKNRIFIHIQIILISSLLKIFC